MAQASLLRQKAEEYKIEIDETTDLWLVCVCKRVLEGHLGWLQLSHHKIISKIEVMEEELLAVKNALEDLFNTDKTPIFAGQNPIHAKNNLLKEIRIAYSEMSIAFSRQEDKQNAEEKQIEEDIAAPHNLIARSLKDISQCFFGCQDAISRALKCFDKNL